jgi:hypothetical protein
MSKPLIMAAVRIDLIVEFKKLIFPKAVSSSMNTHMSTLRTCFLRAVHFLELEYHEDFILRFL